MTMHLKVSATAVIAAACMVLLLAACQQSADDNSTVGAATRERAAASPAANAGDAATPAPAGGGALDRAVVAETLPYVEIGDALVYGHFVFPEDMDDPLPAIIVIHEWWGLNDEVRALADRIAAQGYIVLAVDLFAGETAVSSIDARKLMLSVVENPEDANTNIRSAYEFLNDVASAPKIASVGWGFGGGWSLNTAMLFPDGVDASVIFYGQTTSDEDLLRPVNAPILGLFAEDDRSIPLESVRAFEDSLEKLRKAYEIEVYSGAGQGFSNPASNYYDAHTAALAWDRAMKFLEQHLSE